MRGLRATLLASLAVLALGATAEEAPNGKLEGELGEVRWILQPAQHRVVSHDLVVVIENTTPRPVFARLMWTPVKCGDTRVPLDPFVEPRLIDLVGDLPKIFVLQPGTWRVASYPVGLPVVANSLPQDSSSCTTQVQVTLSTREGKKERWMVIAPIEKPREQSRPHGK